MAAKRLTAFFAVNAALLAAFIVAAGPALAQQPPEPPPLPPARIIVTGSGSVTVAPDYAEIASGVTSQAKTAKDASDANAKVMAALNVALKTDGIAADDIQTLRFSVSPVYGPPQQNGPPKLVGFSVSNELGIKVRQIGKVGEILRFADPSRRDRFRQRAVSALQHVASARSDAAGGAGGRAAQSRALCSERRPQARRRGMDHGAAGRRRACADGAYVRGIRHRADFRRD